MMHEDSCVLSFLAWSRDGGKVPLLLLHKGPIVSSYSASSRAVVESSHGVDHLSH
jgi:hypothetical protein